MQVMEQVIKKYILIQILQVEEVAEAICTHDLVEVVFVDETGYDINFKMTFDDFLEGVVKMTDNMSDGSVQKTINVYH